MEDVLKLFEAFFLEETIDIFYRKKVWEYFEEKGVDETLLGMIEEVLAHQEKTSQKKAQDFRQQAADLKAALELEHSGNALSLREQIIHQAKGQADALVEKFKNDTLKQD